jgi:hypothetical protein
VFGQAEGQYYKPKSRFVTHSRRPWCRPLRNRSIDRSRPGLLNTAGLVPSQRHRRTLGVFASLLLTCRPGMTSSDAHGGGEDQVASSAGSLKTRHVRARTILMFSGRFSDLMQEQSS